MDTEINFHHASPILRVNDLEASINYFCNTLGFELDWQDPTQLSPRHRAATRTSCCPWASGNPPAWVWIGVGDTQALRDEYVAKGARIRMEPTNFPWALEMHVEDLDGNVLRMGSEPLPDHVVGPGWN